LSEIDRDITITKTIGYWEDLLINVRLTEAVPAHGIIAIDLSIRALVVETMSGLAIGDSYHSVSKERGKKIGTMGLPRQAFIASEGGRVTHVVEAGTAADEEVECTGVTLDDFVVGAGAALEDFVVGAGAVLDDFVVDAGVALDDFVVGAGAALDDSVVGAGAALEGFVVGDGEVRTVVEDWAGADIEIRTELEDLTDDVGLPAEGVTQMVAVTQSVIV
jgi:hypothetical protein